MAAYKPADPDMREDPLRREEVQLPAGSPDYRFDASAQFV